MALTPPAVATVLSQSDLRNGSYVVEVSASSLSRLSIQLIVRGLPAANASLSLDVVSPLCDSAGLVLDPAGTTCLCRPGFGVAATDADGTVN